MPVWAETSLPAAVDPLPHPHLLAAGPKPTLATSIASRWNRDALELTEAKPVSTSTTNASPHAANSIRRAETFDTRLLSLRWREESKVKREIALLSALALCLGVNGCKGCRQPVPKGAVQVKMPTEKAKPPQGLKALAVKPGPTPFTQDEVTQYVQTHRLAKTVGGLSQLRVESLEFLTAREVTIRLHGAPTGLPDGERVAFAIIRGPVYFAGPVRAKPVAFERAYALFDAATGNLMMSGTLGQAKQAQETGKPPTGDEKRRTEGPR